MRLYSTLPPPFLGGRTLATPDALAGATMGKQKTVNQNRDLLIQHRGACTIISKPVFLEVSLMEEHSIMSIDIRILGPEDGAILNHVAPDVFDDPIVPQSVQEFLGSPQHQIVVAIDNGLVVGFASAVLYVHPDKPNPELWVNEVGVAPSHQNRGVGKAILRALLDVARKAGCAEAWVLTERQNLPAIRLYQAVGGEEGQDELVMFSFKLEPVTG